MIKQKVLKWLGYLSVGMVLSFDISPVTFHITESVRPWLFVGSLVWIFCIISGVFSK